MIDQFREEVVTRRNRTLENLLMAIANIFMVVSGIFAMFMLQSVLMVISTQGFSSGLILTVLITLLFIASAALLFLFKDRIRTEYE